MSGLILLDRDGVLNRMIVRTSGEVDSPLIAEEVEVDPAIPPVLARLARLGFGLAIVTNQPAAAKGKTTRESLEEVHRVVLEKCQEAGARILSSHICFHRAEDGCACRKPKTGLLEEAFSQNPRYERSGSWMVGDRAIDIQAGEAMGLATAFLEEAGKATGREASIQGLSPRFVGWNLAEFVDYLERK